MNIIKIGRWAFIGGIILAILSALFVIPEIGILLFGLGIIVGLINIQEKESVSFLVSVIALLIIGVAILEIGGLTQAPVKILGQILTFMSAAAFVVAIKQILAVAISEEKVF
ncbi:MAG: hypothetical protein KYQ20_00830 [Candidatus Nealsonbacteria bacterium]|nr:hypothetical protein [Candidatus Nealsonbacteria bacterium]